MSDTKDVVNLDDVQMKARGNVGKFAYRHGRIEYRVRETRLQRLRRTAWKKCLPLSRAFVNGRDVYCAGEFGHATPERNGAADPHW